MHTKLLFTFAMAGTVSAAGPSADRKLVEWDHNLGYGATGASAACNFKKLSDVLCVPISTDGTTVTSNSCGAEWHDNFWQLGDGAVGVNDDLGDGAIASFSQAQLGQDQEIAGLEGSVSFTLPDTDTYKYYYFNSAGEWVEFNSGTYNSGTYTWPKCVRGTASASGVPCEGAGNDVDTGGYATSADVIQNDGSLSSSTTDSVTIGVASKCDGVGAKEQIFAWVVYTRKTGAYELSYEQEHDNFVLTSASNQKPEQADLIWVFGSQSQIDDQSQETRQANMVAIRDENDYEISCTLSLTVSTGQQGNYGPNCYGSNTGGTGADDEFGSGGSSGDPSQNCQASLGATCTFTEQAPIATGALVRYGGNPVVAASLEASAAIIQAIHISNEVSTDDDTGTTVTAQNFMDDDAVLTNEFGTDLATASGATHTVLTPTLVEGQTNIDNSYSTVTNFDNPYRVVAGYYEVTYNYGCQEGSVTDVTGGHGNGEDMDEGITASPGSADANVATSHCYFGEDVVAADYSKKNKDSGAVALEMPDHKMKIIPATTLGPLPDGFPNFYVFGIYTIDLLGGNSQTASDNADTFGSATVSDDANDHHTRRLGATTADRVTSATAKVHM